MIYFAGFEGNIETDEKTVVVVKKLADGKSVHDRWTDMLGEHSDRDIDNTILSILYSGKKFSTEEEAANFLMYNLPKSPDLQQLVDDKKSFDALLTAKIRAKKSGEYNA